MINKKAFSLFLLLMTGQFAIYGASLKRYVGYTAATLAGVGLTSVIANRLYYEYFEKITLEKGEILCDIIASYLELLKKMYKKELVLLEKTDDQTVHKKELENIILTTEKRRAYFYVHYYNKLTGYLNKCNRFERKIDRGIKDINEELEKIKKELGKETSHIKSVILGEKEKQYTALREQFIVFKSDFHIYKEKLRKIKIYTQEFKQYKKEIKYLLLHNIVFNIVFMETWIFCTLYWTICILDSPSKNYTYYSPIYKPYTYYPSYSYTQLFYNSYTPTSVYY